jgi:hypothetical protein
LFGQGVWGVELLDRGMPSVERLSDLIEGHLGRRLVVKNANRVDVDRESVRLESLRAFPLGVHLGEAGTDTLEELL